MFSCKITHFILQRSADCWPFMLIDLFFNL